MKKKELFDYFMEGVAMVVALYEICRTGRRVHKSKRNKY